MEPSISTVAWDGHGLEAALDGAAEAGFRVVEPAFIAGYIPFDEDDFGPGPAQTLRRTMEGRGLSARALSAHVDMTAAGAAERLRRRIGFAAAIGARFVVTNAGPAAGEAAFLAALEAVLLEAEAAGVVLALENPGHGSGDLIPDAAAGAALLERVGAGPERVGLNLDLGNVLTYSGGRTDPAGQVAAAGAHLVHLHLKDVADRDGGWVFVPIGDGEVGYDAILPALPPGVPLGIEMPLRLRRLGRADPVRAEAPTPLPAIAAAAREARAFVAGGR